VIYIFSIKKYDIRKWNGAKWNLRKDEYNILKKYIHKNINY